MDDSGKCATYFERGKLIGNLESAAKSLRNPNGSSSSSLEEYARAIELLIAVVAQLIKGEDKQ